MDMEQILALFTLPAGETHYSPQEWAAMIAELMVEQSADGGLRLAKAQLGLAMAMGKVFAHSKGRAAQLACDAVEKAKDAAYQAGQLQNALAESREAYDQVIAALEAGE